MLLFMQTRTVILSRSIFVGTALLFVSGCGDDVAPQPPYSPPKDVGQPPQAPENATMPDGPGATFAISALKLGRKDPSGLHNPDLWKTIGYNLDHTVTTQAKSGVILNETVCTRVGGAQFSNIIDGNDGRDNAFGSTVMQLIDGVSGDGEKLGNELIRLGKHTLLVDIQGLGESPTYQAMSARMYEGRSFVDAQGMPAIPTFDGTDIWPIAFESVTKGALDAPLAASTNAYVAEGGDGGTFVGQFGGSIVLTLDVLGLADEKGILQLRIHEPLITMRLSADRLSVESGTLAGYLATAELEAEVGRLVGIFDNTLCGGATDFSLRQQAGQTSDILRNGQKDKTKTCDSISLGIEFQATRAQLGMVANPAAPPPNPCAAP